MYTNQICNVIKNFLADFNYAENWSLELDAHLVREGVKTAKPTTDEKADGEFLVAIGDQAFYLDCLGGIVALEREVPVIIVADGNARPYWTGCGWSSDVEQAEEHLPRDIPVSIEDHEGETLDWIQIDGYHAYAAPGAESAYATTREE